MSIKDYIKGALKEPYPYNEDTFHFPESMQKLGYDIKHTDTIVDANARVILQMAKRIEALEQQNKLI